jgi:hypothetical protein
MGLIDRLFGRKTTTPGLHAKPAGQPTPASIEPAPQSSALRPPKCPANPGRMVVGKVAFATGERSWTESFDLIRITADVLRDRGHEAVGHETWLELRPSGFILQPLLVEIQPLEQGGVRTLTTIDVHHVQLIKEGLFEYQHSTGDDVVGSLTKGFESWESVDLPVLLDALRPKPEKCALWEMVLPAKERVPARTRRAVLGGVAYFAEDPPEAGGVGCDETAQEDCEHPFCTCCFLTRNFEAFRSQIEGDGCFGIRFYAMRDKDGTAAADCRINGEDYEPGMEALRSYVATWPGAGLEFRKQYVLLHTIPVAES